MTNARLIYAGGIRHQGLPPWVYRRLYDYLADAFGRLDANHPVLVTISDLYVVGHVAGQMWQHLGGTVEVHAPNWQDIAGRHHGYLEFRLIEGQWPYQTLQGTDSGAETRAQPTEGDMDLWYAVALVLLTVAAGISAAQRAWTTCLLCAGLAAWVLPQAWAAIH